MLEYVGLDPLVRFPLGRLGKGIDLQREARGPRIQLAHEQGHPLPVQIGPALQIAGDVGTEHAEIGQLGGGKGTACLCLVRLSPVYDVGQPALDIVLHQGDLAIAVDHLPIAKAHGIEVEMDRALDASPTALLHAAPVTVGRVEQFVCRDGRDRLVPVLDLDRVERDVEHVAVRIVGRHLDPVPLFHQVVGVDLEAGDEREQRVLKEQQQDRHHRTQAAEEHQRRLAGKERDAEDDADGDHDQLEQVQVALNGLAPVVAAPLIDLVDRIEQRVAGHQGQPQDQEQQDLAYRPHSGRQEIGEIVQHHQRRDPGETKGMQVLDDDVVDLVPGAPGDVGQAARQEIARYDKGDGAEQHHDDALHPGR